MNLRLYHLETHSRANGPGLRAVVWVQGCTLSCPECFNPETHPIEGGTEWQIDALANVLMKVPDIEGITISGGEPLQQIEALTELLQRIRRQSDLSIIVFTGFERAEMEALPHSEALLDQVDVLITGRYVAKQRQARGLIGSANQEIHCLTDRYTPRDFENIPEAEIILMPDGEIHLTGIRPPEWQA